MNEPVLILTLDGSLSAEEHALRFAGDRMSLHECISNLLAVDWNNEKHRNWCTSVLANILSSSLQAGEVLTINEHGMWSREVRATDSSNAAQGVDK